MRESSCRFSCKREVQMGSGQFQILYYDDDHEEWIPEIMKAIRNNEFDFVGEYLAAQGRNSRAAFFESCVDPALLEEAIYSKQPALVELFLSHKASVLPDRNGKTPLHIAVKAGGTASIIRILLDAINRTDMLGSNIMQNRSRMLAIGSAITLSGSNLFSLIKSDEEFSHKQKKLSTLMLQSFNSGRFIPVQNARNISVHGLTPLHLAIISENVEAISLLENVMRDPVYNRVKLNCPLPIYRLYEIFFPHDLVSVNVSVEACDSCSFE